jgi:hypothetical protein
MKPIYCIYADNYEAMFDMNGKLLSYWHENDATWRDEYFADFVAQLGVEVVRPRKGHPVYKKLVGKLKEEVARL